MIALHTDIFARASRPFYKLTYSCACVHPMGDRAWQVCILRKRSGHMDRIEIPRCSSVCLVRCWSSDTQPILLAQMLGVFQSQSLRNQTAMSLEIVRYRI